MFLVTAATEFEMKAFAEAGGLTEHTGQLVTGIGPVETTLRLASLLHAQPGQFAGVLNFGIAGAYPDNGTTQTLGILDVCLAEQEILGDLGICLQGRFERFSSEIVQVDNTFLMDSSLLSLAGGALDEAGIEYRKGTFVTVNCASGTLERGQLLGREFGAICENMEGAAVARVCKEFVLPCLEVRCISNMVEDRDTNKWQLKKACAGAGLAAAVIARSLLQ